MPVNADFELAHCVNKPGSMVTGCSTRPLKIEHAIKPPDVRSLVVDAT